MHLEIFCTETEWIKIVELEYNSGNKIKKWWLVISLIVIVMWAKNIPGIQPSGGECPTQGEKKKEKFQIAWFLDSFPSCKCLCNKENHVPGSIYYSNQGQTNTDDNRHMKRY